uniref:Uncharacterized protein n=1 Tax=Stylonychia lemnae TaxID=5949 RepID=A0A3Q8BBZ5_STYLE|nr:hypothetical protein [Stylonychia lemnae]
MSSYSRSSSLRFNTITRENRVSFIGIKFVKRMIRRWSHINYFQATVNSEKSKSFKSFNYIRKVSKAYVFRTSLVSRRFNRRYLTKFKRKAYNRIRHRTNWSIYYSIFKFWSLDFLNNKYPIKFEYMLNNFTDNFFFFNFNFVKNKSPEGFSNWNFIYANKVIPKPSFPVNKWDSTILPVFGKKTGTVSLGWSDLKFDNTNLPVKDTMGVENIENLFVNDLAIPFYSFWDEQSFPSAHSLTNYSSDFDYDLIYQNSIKCPDFDISKIEFLFSQLIYNKLILLRQVSILNFINE